MRDVLDTAQLNADSADDTVREGRNRRVLWSVADQILSSATNFALTILVARDAAPSAFGAFALLMAVYVVVTGIVRALTSEVIAVRLSPLPPVELGPKAAPALGASVAGGVCVGVVIVAVAGLLGGSRISAALFILGFSLPLLLVQDTLRYIFVAGRRPARAFAIDLVWAVAQAVGVVMVLAEHSANVATLTASWAGAGVISALVGLGLARAAPQVREASRWLVANRDLAVPFAVEFMAGQGANQLSLFSVGAIAGLSAAGAFRGVQALFGPLTVLSSGLALAVIPEFSRLLKAGSSRFTLGCAAFGVVVATGALATGGVLVALPAGFGRALLGASWGLASPLVLFVTVQKVGEGIGIGAFVGMRSRQYAVSSASLRTVVGLASIATAAVGADIAGAHGVVIGLAITMPLASAVWWSQLLRRSRHERGRALHGAERAAGAAT